MSLKKVLIFGTFDYFHAGHEDLIKQAKALGPYLIVLVARDETVKQIKGVYPEHKEKARLALLKNHPEVDKAVLGDLQDKYKVIKKYRPNVIALGYDQFVFTYGLKKLLIDLKLNAEIIRLKPYQPKIYKSSLIKQQTKAKNETQS